MHLNKFDIDSVAIGNFDGIHKGHQELLKNLTKNGALVVIEINETNLTPGSKREQYSHFPCFYYDFYLIKDMSGDEFVKMLCKDFVNLKKIVVGYDFKFAKDRVCSGLDLKKLFDGEVIIVDEFKLNNVGVHSSDIKKLLKDGCIFEANNFLGRQYSIEGNIVQGQGIGKKELYATLNLNAFGYFLPKDGVYATKTKVLNKIYNSVTFIGNRLTSDGNFAIETHILDDFIKQKIETAEIFFVKYLRENLKFNSYEELKNQISKDIQTTKILLANLN